MANYDVFKIEQKDFDELHRILKKGRFCVLNLPKEGAENQEYLEKISEYLKFAGKQEYLNLIINLFNESEQKLIQDFGVNTLEDLKDVLKKAHAFKSLIGEEKLVSFEREFSKKISGKHFKELEDKYLDAGFEIYAKIDWNKQTQVNQGRVVKDREQLYFLSKGRARDDLRSNNKMRMKIFDSFLNKPQHKIYSFVSEGIEKEEFHKMLSEWTETKDTNRAKKRDLLEKLRESPVTDKYLSFFENEVLAHGEKVVRLQHGPDYSDFQQFYSTINATMM